MIWTAICGNGYSLGYVPKRLDLCPVCDGPVHRVQNRHVPSADWYACQRVAARIDPDYNKATQPTPAVVRVRVRRRHMAPAEVVKIRKQKKSEPEVAVVGRRADDKAKAARRKSDKPTSEGKANPGNRFVGATTGKSVLEFQNKTLEDNRKAHLSDEELAKMWRTEFPKAKAYTAEDVAGVRNSYNKGKHGNEAPAENKRIPEYNDAGEALPFWGEKSAAKKAKAEVAAAPKAKTAPVTTKRKKIAS